MRDDLLPGTVVRLVRLLLPAERAEETIGDLQEGFGERATRLGAGRARRWLWREVAGLLWWRFRVGGRWRSASVDDAAINQEDGMTMWARDFLQDVRFGLRELRRRPGFAATAILVLGLGIGAPTTVFSIVNRIFFQRPAGVQEPHRLVRLYRAWEGGGGGSLGNADYEYFRNAATTLSGLAAYSGSGLIASYSVGGERSDQLRVERVSDNFFDVLGVTPVLGRDFLPEENATPGAHPVVVLSHGFWRRAFGGDLNSVGRTMTLNGSPYTVIGILPEAYEGIDPASSTADAWVPIAMSGALERSTDAAWWERHPNFISRWLNVIGRLAPGVTFEAAEANLHALHAALEYDGKDEDERLWVRRQWLYSPRTADHLADLAKMLLAVVGIVLAIAAANVAVLLLARASTRDREIAVRAAMGASRGRITRQLVAESLILGGAATVTGIGIAYASADFAAALLPVSFGGSFAPDWRVMVIALALSAATAALVGLAAALQALRSNLRSRVHAGTEGLVPGRARAALVVGQLALSVMLVSGALLFTRSFWTARSQDVGFSTDDRLVVRVRLRSFGYDEPRGRAFVGEALGRIAGLPGVRAVATSRMVPFGGQWSTNQEPPPDASPSAPEETEIGLNVVSPGYFDIMGMRILRGRSLGGEDVAGAPFSIVINEALADAFWPGESAIGRTIPSGYGGDATVVGVVANANYYELGEEPVAHLWMSFDQVYRPTVSFLVETGVPAARMAGPVQNVLRDVDPDIAFASVTTLEERMSEQVARYEVTAVLVGMFGGLALLLAAVGLYGVISFLVSQRTREIGVRMALGANRARVGREVMASASRLAVAGVVLGLVGAVTLRRFTESFLFRVEATDPLPLGGAVAVLLLSAACASLVPARRASRVDPMVAIRAD